MPDLIELQPPPLPDKISTFTLDRPGDPDQVPEGFTLAHAADAGLLAEVLAEARELAGGALDAADEAVLRPDLELAYLRGGVRPALLPLLAEWDRRQAAHVADPGRRRLNAEGLQEADARFTGERDAALAKVEAQVSGELAKIEAEAAQALAQGKALPVTAAHDDHALRLAASLSHMTPAHGLPVLAAFIREGLEDPALLFAAVPFLRSMYDKEGTPWTRHVGLLQAATACQKVLDGLAARQTRPAEARLARVARTRWELSQAMRMARDPDKAARDGAFAAVDHEDRLVLFPDAPAPRPPAKRGSRTVQYEPIRRLAVSAERRAADRRRRAALDE